VAASQIKALLDELASVLAEMGALDEAGEGSDDSGVARADGEMPPAMPEDEEEKEEEMPAEAKAYGGEPPMAADEEDAEEEEAVKARSLDTLMKRAEKIKSKISFYERKAEKEREIRSVLERAAPASVVTKESAMPVDKRIVALPGHSTLRAFTGHNAAERAYRAGMHIRGYIFGDAEARRWCQDHGVESRAQAGGINGLGGVLVADEMSREIIRLVEEYGVFPQYARRVQMNSDTLVIARRKSGLAARPVGENVEITASDVEFDNVQLVAKIWGCANRIPNSLLEDSVIDLADTMAIEIAQAYAEAFDNAGFIGDGSSSYHGTVGAATAIVDGTHSAGVVSAKTNNTTFDMLELRDFTSVIAKLPMYAKRNAAWYISPVGFGAAMTRLALNPGAATSGAGTQTISGGGNTSSEVGSGWNTLNFLGFPVRLTHSLESNLTGTTGKVACLFGDLAQAATFGERRSIGIQTARERYIELDQTLIHATTRNAMVVHDLGSTAKAGPLVALKFA
jgi:HK97 family phage major capsid protein